MQHNELVDKLTQLENRIKELEAINAQYYAEKRDKTFRNDMAEDGKIDQQPISREMAIQIVNSFYNEYDKQARQNIEDLRQRDPSNKAIAEYDAKLSQITQLKKEFHL